MAQTTVFEYGEPFYQLGPFLGDGETEYEFAITDNEDSECSDYYDLGTVSCDFISNVINFEKLDKQLLFIKNILGRTVNNLNSNSPYIYFYDDCSFEKKIIFTIILLSSIVKFKHFINSDDSSWITFIHGAGGSSTIWHKQSKY